MRQTYRIWFTDCDGAEGYLDNRGEGIVIEEAMKIKVELESCGMRINKLEPLEERKIYGCTENEIEFVSQLTGMVITESHLMEVAIDDSKYFTDMTVAEILSNIYILKKGTSGDPSFTAIDYMRTGYVPADKFSVDELNFA